VARGTFLIALVVSTGLHVWLLSLRPASSAPISPTPADVVTVVQTDLARPDHGVTEETPLEKPPPASEPVPEPESRTRKEPEPGPAPENEPQPLETPASPPRSNTPKPIRTASPPSPRAEPSPSSPPAELVATAVPARGPAAAGGDLGGEPEGRLTPELRIDWGSESDALAALEAGQMMLVILEGPPSAASIAGQAVLDEGGWHRAPYRPALVAGPRYSNRLRIVDEVPAFAAARVALGVGRLQRLAVLVPLPVERLLQSALTRAAFDGGITTEGIRSLGGRFTVDQGELGFVTTHVRFRAEE
jgi:outer membrane biosynthesis protein TonB